MAVQSGFCWELKGIRRPALPVRVSNPIAFEGWLRAVSAGLPVAAVGPTAAVRFFGVPTTVHRVGNFFWGQLCTLRQDHKRTILSPVKFGSTAMRYSSQVRPISYLKANAAEVLTNLAQRREPLVITQNGEAKAVLQDVASFEETQEALALLKILALGNQDVAAGKVKPVADVIARLRAKRASV